MGIPAQTFIIVWQRSKTLEDVANHFNLTNKQVVLKASILRRKRGIPLKYFAQRNSTPDLISLAREYLREHAKKA